MVAIGNFKRDCKKNNKLNFGHHNILSLYMNPVSLHNLLLKIKLLLLTLYKSTLPL